MTARTGRTPLLSAQLVRVFREGGVVGRGAGGGGRGRGRVGGGRSGGGGGGATGTEMLKLSL